MAVQRTLSKELKPGSANKLVKIKLEFTLGFAVPKISVLDSSGDGALDQAVLQAMSDYRFPYEPIQPEDQKTWKVSAIVTLSSK